MIAVSLILATCGRVEEVRRCLKSFSWQTCQDFEVLVIDQNQDERLSSIVHDAKQAGLQLRHIRLYPPSLSAARNLGIREAHGDVVAFPDDDCWYEHEVIENVVRCFADNESLAGAVGLWVEQASTMRQTLAETLELEQWRRFRDSTASSITLFFRTNVIVKLGGFDQRLGVGCWYGAGEETDVVIRALSDSYRMKRLDTARVHHAFSNSDSKGAAASFLRARTRSRGTGALYAKHKFEWLVIMRGLTAPFIHAIMGKQAIAAAAGTVIGRFEGFLRWQTTER